MDPLPMTPVRSSISSPSTSRRFNSPPKYKVFISTTDKLWVYLIGFLVILFIVVLVFLLYRCWQRWGKHIQILDSQIVELKK